jgi:hypothetical protein
MHNEIFEQLQKVKIIGYAKQLKKWIKPKTKKQKPKNIYLLDVFLLLPHADNRLPVRKLKAALLAGAPGHCQLHRLQRVVAAGAGGGFVVVVAVPLLLHLGLVVRGQMAQMIQVAVKTKSIARTNGPDDPGCCKNKKYCADKWPR